MRIADNVACNEVHENIRPSKRYLIIINDIQFLYSHFWALAISIQQAGWDVIVAARCETSPQQAIDVGIQFIPLKLKVGVGGPISEIKSALALRAVIHSINPDIVHLVSIKNVLIGGLIVSRRNNVALLGAITGLGSLFVETNIFYLLLRPLVLYGMKYVFKYPRSIMALENTADQQFFVENKVVDDVKCSVIPGAGIDIDSIFPNPHNNVVPVIICVSRMIRNKGILNLIDAAQILHREGVRFELLLVGDIDVNNPTSLSREELRTAEENSIVKWLGYRIDIPHLIANSDIFCLPSYYREGLPRALVEASAAGCSIVTTDIPGCREVVVNGVNGILVPPRDTILLAGALRCLLKDAMTCKQMGMESRKRFEQLFTTASVFAAFNRCYNALDISLQV